MNQKRPRSDPKEEARLVDRMLLGDERAFRAFFAAYYRPLVGFAGSRSSLDPASIEDVVQATLIKAIRGLPRFRRDAALFTWLCSICWRELLTVRARRRSVAAFESLESLPESDVLALHAPEGCEPDRALDAEHHRSAISRALCTLPPHYARALEMKYIEGRAVRELAHALGITVIGAQSLLSRARAAFRVAFPASA